MFKKITRIMFGPLEHQMFEEMSEAALAAFFILGTHVIPEIYSHNRELCLAAHDHIEAVFQGRLGEAKVVQRVRVDHGRGMEWNKSL
ncbi:MAG: hypothetical protein ACLQGP_00640 [Isosphaeraceae bacterium]